MNTEPGWYPDPYRRHEVRYWDGSSWTESIKDAERPGTDPLDSLDKIDSALVAVSYTHLTLPTILRV